MGASYYVVRNNNHEDRKEFSDTCGVINAVRHQDEGEIYILGLADVAKITYNLQTGHVSLEAVEDQNGITTFFSESAFDSFLQPITEAIRLLMQMDLLKKLHALGDPAISFLIEKSHPNFASNLTPNGVYQTLLKLQYPTGKNLSIKQVALAGALCEVGIDNIKSRHSVNAIMNKVA